MEKEKKSSIEKKTIINYIQRANNYSKENKYEKAFAIFQKALNLAESINDSKSIATVNNNIGRNKFYIGDYEKAMEHYMISLPLYEKITDRIGIGTVLLNIGSLYTRQNHLENALIYFNKSLETYKSINAKKGICYAINNAATIYNSIGEKEKAKNMYKESIEIAKSLGDKVQLAICLNNLGDVEMHLKHFKTSLEYYEKALQLEKELKCDRNLCLVLFNMAEVYFNLKDSKNMLYFLNEALQKAQEAKSNHIKLLCYKLYYTYYEKIEDFKKALRYYKLYSKQNEITFNEKRTKAIAELQVKYDTYKKEKEKEIYMLKNTELIEVNQKLQKAYKELEDIHKIDHLTKLYNREAITSLMEKEFFHKKNDTPFIVCIADIDDFKKINDNYGHDAGDEVLCYYSKVLKESLREADYIGRWGGEEFLIILPKTNLEDGTKVIERLRTHVSEKKLLYYDHEIKLTMTFGLGCFYGEQEMNQCIKLADKFLYKGKNCGKNCVKIVI